MTFLAAVLTITSIFVASIVFSPDVPIEKAEKIEKVEKSITSDINLDV